MNHSFRRTQQIGAQFRIRPVQKSSNPIPKTSRPTKKSEPLTVFSRLELSFGDTVQLISESNPVITVKKIRNKKSRSLAQSPQIKLNKFHSFDQVKRTLRNYII